MIRSAWAGFARKKQSCEFAGEETLFEETRHAFPGEIREEKNRNFSILFGRCSFGDDDAGRIAGK
jgi:hypothetical protein